MNWSTSLEDNKNVFYMCACKFFDQMCHSNVVSPINWTILYRPYHMEHFIWTISYGAYYMDHIIWTILYGKWCNWLEFRGFSYRDIYIICWISSPDRGTKKSVWQNWFLGIRNELAKMTLLNSSMLVFLERSKNNLHLYLFLYFLFF